MSFLLILCLLGAFAAGYHMLIGRVILPRLRYHRKFAKPTYFAGETAELLETVRNDGPFFLPWLRVESRIPSSFRFGGMDNLDVKGDMYHKSLFFMRPYRQITRRHRVTLLARGHYDIGNATLTAGELLGLGEGVRQVEGHARVLVFPALMNEDELPSPFAQLIGECIQKHALLTDPYLVRGIRPYRAGDNVRDIHWGATARTGELQLRLHDFTASTRLLVIINSQTREDQWDNLMDYEKPVVEKAISMAATLCISVLRAGLSAGFACNMPLEGQDTRENTLLLPRGGRETEEEILSLMARLQVKRTRSFATFLQELQSLSGLDLLVLSPYDSPTIRENLSLLRERGNSVRLYIMEEGEVPLDA